LIDSIVAEIAAVFIVGFVVSFAMEGLLKPAPVAPWRRPLASLGVHVGIITVAFALELLLFRRPFFAMVNVWAIQLVMIAVSRVKSDTLNEAFVYPDFEYFLDAIKHPRLYLPFFGGLRALAAAAGYGVVLWAGLAWEQAIDVSPAWLGSLTAAILAGGVLTVTSGRNGHALAVRFDANDDLRRLGMLCALWRYRLAEREPVRVTSASASRFATAASSPAADILVVQSESFFDARRVFASVRDDVLTHFDALKSQACAHGTLQVAAWGANTVRTEFAFLSGLEPDSLGVHRFNPYRRLAGQGVATLASHLRAQGYRTLCIHPYPASFYRRAAVYPTLGFDEFHDISAFESAERFGPYVSDRAVAQFIERLYAARGDDARPWFIFVITMENHGPLHWESVTDADARRYLTPASSTSRVPESGIPQGCADLVAYVRHLEQADGMFATLAETLSASSRPSVMCLYGDHVPIMPAVYRALGTPDGQTDYLIWRPVRQGAPVRQTGPLPLAVSALAAAILDHAAAPTRVSDR